MTDRFLAARGAFEGNRTASFMRRAQDNPIVFAALLLTTLLSVLGVSWLELIRRAFRYAMGHG